MNLDPEDPRPPYMQVANTLRASILTKKLAPGEQLPSGNELAKTYGVSRQTVLQAVRVIRDEGLVVSRQGSGVYVRERTERPIGLRPHIDRAFSEPHVTLDFAGYSGETLHGALQESLDKIRTGRHTPESVHIRALILDTTSPWTFPCTKDDLADDPSFRRRMHRISARHAEAISDSVRELAELGLVADATAEFRVHSSAPQFKLYILNGRETFFGFYPVTEFTVNSGDESRVMYNLMGKDSILFNHAATDDAEAIETQQVSEAQRWFDSMWTTIAREFQP